MYDRPLSYYKEQRKGTPLVFFTDSSVKLNRIISDGGKLGFFTAVLTVQPDVAEVADVVSAPARRRNLVSEYVKL